MKKIILTVTGLSLALIPTAALAYNQCSSWSPVYAKAQPQCTCDYFRDRGGRKVLKCF